MEKKRVNKTRPLLDKYIQKKNQESNFDGIGEEEIAQAIRTLLQADIDTPRGLN